MMIKEIIEILKEREKDFLKTKSFSQQPGIYAFFYIGDNFPILGNDVSQHQIIYIGKTESSQEKRDAKTHFTTGKTGSSTVRKSIGSILHSVNNLKPIPRNNSDYKKGRLSHFKFDHQSEVTITEWMKKNLALSFYEYPRTKEEIENLETNIINELVPILNISKNPRNGFKDQLKQLRKSCALIAAKEFTALKPDAEQTVKHQQQGALFSMKTSGKYNKLWTENITIIIEKLKKSQEKQSIQMKSEDFKIVGNRKSYSFNLEFSGGVVSNNIGGSAVARDLASVLQTTIETRDLLKVGHHKIRMDKEFCLWIERL